jgi:hypothetical protein
LTSDKLPKRTELATELVTELPKIMAPSPTAVFPGPTTTQAMEEVLPSPTSLLAPMQTEESPGRFTTMSLPIAIASACVLSISPGFSPAMEMESRPVEITAPPSVVLKAVLLISFFFY